MTAVLLISSAMYTTLHAYNTGIPFSIRVHVCVCVDVYIYVIHKYIPYTTATYIVSPRANPIFAV